MVTRITFTTLITLLATAALSQARVLTYSTEAEFQLQNAATTPPATSALKATVREVVGIAQARKSETEAWQSVKVGQVYEEGVEFRTGIRSRVVFQVPPDQTIILDRLGVVKLLIARGGGNEVRTSLGMPYGRTEYQVEEAGLQHTADIAAPGATLAVRGTKNMLLYDQGPFTPIAHASQPVRLRNAKGQLIAFGRAGGRARIAADKNSPGETSLVQSRVDPVGAFSGHTASENAVISYMQRVSPGLDITKFGVFSKLNDPNFKGSITGVLPTPGQLQFTLLWTTSFFSDLDIAVTSPKGERVSFKNPRVKSSGELTKGDEVSIKGQGQETILWKNTYPVGKYKIAISQKGTSKGGSTYNVFVIKDPGQKTGGQQIGQFSGKIPNETVTGTHTITVGPSVTQQVSKRR
jgi:hypothetical protein